MGPIFTLNARGNVMLEVMRDYFKLDNPAVKIEIQTSHLKMQEILASKGFKYSNLKSALVPMIDSDKHEVGFIFDSQYIDSSWYGYEVAQAIIPLLDKRTNQSVLCGDLIGGNQQFIFEIIEESLVLSRSFKFVHGSLLYCVYVNNLSCKLLERLHAELANFRPYVGFIPANYSSRAKIYLSTILVNSFLKHGNHVIMGHEDDRPNTENVNIVGLPFEEFGYQISSLQSIYFDLFLSYKIERPVYSGFEVDTEMSLNAITDQIIPLEGCSILVEDAKHKYLLSEKGGKLCKAGIEDIGRNELETLIQSKITASYIYNLVYLEKYNVYKFNLILEISRPDMDDPVKFLVAIEYKPEEKVLRVLTLY